VSDESLKDRSSSSAIGVLVEYRRSGVDLHNDKGEKLWTSVRFGSFFRLSK
jgi:hypothetical protein